MRIGIITYWQSYDNYGQLLQCFALQKYLMNLGYDVFLIRYDFANRKLPSNKWKRLAKIALVYPVIKRIFQYKLRQTRACQMEDLKEKNRLRKFDDFRKSFVVSSDLVYHSIEELQNNPPKADAYITGSDQVWSQLLNIKENEVFYLNFGKTDILRLSYAASFSMDEYPKPLWGKLHDNLQRLNAVSVREQVGVDICKKVGVNATLVVDPTLLLDCSIYRKLSVKKHIEKYVYIYSLNIASSAEINYPEILRFANKSGAKVIATPASGCLPGLELFESAEYDYATIPNWIANIDNSVLTVTTSFHGIVFCLLLHTPFVYVPLRGNLSKMNNRATNLLGRVGLENRILKDSRSFDEISQTNVNWEQVDEKLYSIRQNSYDFINFNLR